MSEKIKAVIFDVDGVLLDSMGPLSEMPADFLRTKGIEPKPDLGEQLFHRTNLMGATYIVEDYKLKLDPETLAQEMIDYQAKNYIENMMPKPGVEETLEFLQKNNIPMLIATSNERIMVEGALERLGLLTYFEGVLTSPEVGSSKENPEIFYEAIKILDVPKENALLFEDGIHAIKTANEMELAVVGVYDETSKNKQTEVKKLADQYVTDLAEWLQSDNAKNLTIPRR